MHDGDLEQIHISLRILYQAQQLVMEAFQKVNVDDRVNQFAKSIVERWRSLDTCTDSDSRGRKKECGSVAHAFSDKPVPADAAAGPSPGALIEELSWRSKRSERFWLRFHNSVFCTWFCSPF